MRVIFSATIAIILLTIYVYLVAHGIEVATCVSDDHCNTLTKADFNDQMASSLTLIGGLVAALVIAELSITKPGQAPAARLLDPETSERRKKLMQLVTGLYLLVWLVTGLSAFLGGYLTVDPKELPALADLGQGWLGIAVGAGYAYFGIKP